MRESGINVGIDIIGHKQRCWPRRSKMENPIWLWLCHQLHCPRSRNRRDWGHSLLFAWWCSWRCIWNSYWHWWWPSGSDLDRNYIIANLIGPELRFVDIVAFFLQVLWNDAIDFLLHKCPDAIECCFVCLSHSSKNYLNYKSHRSVFIHTRLIYCGITALLF